MSEQPIRLGVAGLGLAGSVMVEAAARHPRIELVAGADPHAAPREAFTAKFARPAHNDIKALVDDPDIEAIYIATPHQFHRPHAIAAAQAGKHIIVEKPLALTLEDCDAIIEAIDKAGVSLVVGHTHGFDPNVREMRRIIASGEVGRLGLIAMWNYTNFIYRPRRPEELDTSKGGGIIFNQIPHQIDTIRVLSGSNILSVRGVAMQLDPERPTEGLASALFQFDNGAAASIVYSGYDHFDADECHHWIAESGAPKPTDQHGAAYRALKARTDDEAALRTTTFGLGAKPYQLPPHQPHFGAMIVTCQKADLRAGRDSIMVYGRDGLSEVPIPRGDGVPGRREALDDLWAAVRNGTTPLHDARWGRATLAAALALLQSAREDREVKL